jgi:Uma2 family endonuclease
MSPPVKDRISSGTDRRRRRAVTRVVMPPGFRVSDHGFFTLPNTAIRGPDASWMTRERWAALPKQEREKFSHICPDFVVEPRSKNDDMTKLREKMEEYIVQGIRLGWLIDPKGGTVEIYRPGQPVEDLERPATLSGEDVLPGFILNLKGILFD